MRVDQAEGLRRLLGQERREATVVVAPRASRAKTLAVLGLTRRLGASGRRVLLVDENAGPANSIGALGFKARRDLVQVLSRECTLDEAVLWSAEGLGVLSAHRAAGAALRQVAGCGLALAEGVRSLAIPPDTLLVDALPGTTGTTADVLCECFGAREIVLVAAPDSDSIVGGYGLLKRAAGEPRVQRFGLIVVGARDAAGALALHRNIDLAARRFLGMGVVFLGHLAASRIQAAASR
jgi:flagellar biosynthesis protein FlhG